MPQLIVRRSGKLIRRFPFKNDIVTIGRENPESADNPDLALEDKSRRVSRYHAAIVRDREEKYFIRDLASANGTLVNGHLVHGCYLNESDRISLGGFELQFSELMQLPADLSQAIRVVSSASGMPGGGRKTCLDAFPENYHGDLRENMRETLHDIILRLQSMTSGAGLYEEFLHCIIPAVAARRGMVARARSAESLVPLALSGIDMENGEQMAVSAEYIDLALTEGKTVGAFFAGKAIICRTLNTMAGTHELVYLEKERGGSFNEDEEHFFDLLSAEVGKVREKLKFDDNENRVDPAQRFHWKTEMVTNSDKMRSIENEINAASDIDSNVLLRGETGTGKEITARVIHNRSARSRYPFVAVELSNLEKEMVSGTLLGWVKGAYTGAESDNKGAFQTADGGSVFLDEIGDVGLDVQVKLRRAVEEKEIYPVGSAEAVKVDVKVLAATNIDLDRAVSEGAFRGDLLQRFGKSIHLPPLRERKSDIPLLVCFFIDKQKPPLRAVSHGAMRLLTRYHWPGNIRELRELIKELATRNKEYIFSFDLPKRFFPSDSERKSDKSTTLAESEKQEIIRVLNQVGWNKSQAARMLGFGSKQTLYNKIKKYNIIGPGQRS